MNKHKTVLSISLSIICNIDSPILRYIIKTTTTPPHSTQLLKLPLSPMTAYKFVVELELQIWKAGLILRTWMRLITSHLWYIDDTTPPPPSLPPVFTQYMFFFTFITCFFFFHSRLSILLSLQYYTVSVLLSINPHFLFSFYPCFTPQNTLVCFKPVEV